MGEGKIPLAMAQVGGQLKMSEAILRWNGAARKATDRAAWEQFVRQHGTLPQSAAWGAYKQATGWRVVRKLGWNDDAVVGGVQMLVKPLLGLHVGIVREGALVSDEQTGIALMRKVMEEVSLLVWQPPQDMIFSAETIDYLDFQPNPIKIIPRATVVCDLTQSEEMLLANMRKKTRYWVRRSTREGVTVRRGARGDLPIFFDLHKRSAEQLNYTPTPYATYAAMWEHLTDHLQLFVATVNGEAVAAQLLTAFGDTVTTKRIGWKREFADFRPIYALDWAAMRWAKQNGYRHYDFDGIDHAAAHALLAGDDLPDQFLQTPTFYKIGFGGNVQLCRPTYLYTRNPILRHMIGNWLSRSWMQPVTNLLQEKLT